MKRPGPGLTALAELRQRGLDDRARAFDAARMRVSVLSEQHQAMRAAADDRAAHERRLREAEGQRARQGLASMADLVRGAEYFAASDAALEQQRRNVARARQLLDGGLSELARARAELERSHAEREAAKNLLERRTAEESNRLRRAQEEDAADLVRARGAEREGSS